jgi:2-keto-3-deoxy-L-rhamnonate aldolase RhmA
MKTSRLARSSHLSPRAPCCAPRHHCSSERRRRAAVTVSRRAAGGGHKASLGMFVCSGAPSIAEPLVHTGLDWVCIDAQHGAVDYSRLHDLLAATAAGTAKRIVRVGGPDDRYGMQQALE